MTTYTVSVKSLTLSSEDNPTFTFTKADKTITCVATNCTSVYWTFGDGSQGVGTSTSHTYSDYGTYNILIDYLEVGADGDRKATVRTVKIDGSSGTDDDSELTNISPDIFSKKPIIIPAECTGDISITASIQDLDTPEQQDKSQQSDQVSAYISFSNITIPASEEIEIEIDKDTTKTTEFEFVTVSECDLTNLEFIPAFYTSGSINVQYVVGEVEDEDGEFNFKPDIQISFPDAFEVCPWYEGNLSYESQVASYLMKSDNSEVEFPSITEGTTIFHSFGMAQWSQLPPFEIKWFVDSPATDVAIKRAVLPSPKFKLIFTNESNGEVQLKVAKFTFTWNYNHNDIFMNMRTEGNRRKKQARIYTLPKGAEATRLSNLNFPVYAVVDGYKVGPPPEIVKVYAQWNEYYEDGDYYFPTTILLEPVEGMNGTDYPTCLYKSSSGGTMAYGDFIRVTDGGWMNNDGIIVLDAPKIAASEHYRTINVKVQDDKSPDDPEAVFVIETSPNTSVDDQISDDELSANVSKVHFFNKVVDFAPSVTVTRYDIDPMFYETLWQTYDKAAVLESIAEEPLYYVNFSINDYPKTVPIYHNQTLSFSDSLSHAMEGIRSGEIFYIDSKTPNIINMQCPTKNKYKVKFKVNYELYKDVYIITSDDY